MADGWRIVEANLTAAVCEELRIARRLDARSVSSIARDAGVSRQRLSEVLNAEGANLRLATVERCAAALGLFVEIRLTPAKPWRQRRL